MNDCYLQILHVLLLIKCYFETICSYYKGGSICVQQRSDTIPSLSWPYHVCFRPKAMPNVLFSVSRRNLRKSIKKKNSLVQPKVVNLQRCCYVKWTSIHCSDLILKASHFQPRVRPYTSFQNTFLFCRAMDAWNVLSQIVVEAATIVGFKRLYHRHVDMWGNGGLRIMWGKKKLFKPGIIFRVDIVDWSSYSYAVLFYVNKINDFTG